MDMPLDKYINTYVNILLRTFSEAHFHNIDMKYYLRLARKINDILHRIFLDHGAGVLVHIIHIVCLKTNYCFGPIDSNILKIIHDKGCVVTKTYCIDCISKNEYLAKSYPLSFT